MILSSLLEVRQVTCNMQYHSSHSPKNMKLQLRRLAGDRGSLGELGPCLTLRAKLEPFQSPQSQRNRPNRKYKLRQELLIPVLEPRLKLPSLPPLFKENLGKCGRMSSALRIPTTRRSEEEDSILVYKELRQGQGLVFCPPAVRSSAI